MLERRNRTKLSYSEGSSLKVRNHKAIRGKNEKSWPGIIGSTNVCGKSEELPRCFKYPESLFLDFIHFVDSPGKIGQDAHSKGSTMVWSDFQPRLQIKYYPCKFWRGHRSDEESKIKAKEIPLQNLGDTRDCSQHLHRSEGDSSWTFPRKFIQRFPPDDDHDARWNVLHHLHRPSSFCLWCWRKCQSLQRNSPDER